MSRELKKLRKKIDEIDDKILSLLSKRIKTAKKISKIKKQNNFKIIDRKREKEIFSKLIKKSAKLGLNKIFVIELFRRIIKQSKKEQE